MRSLFVTWPLIILAVGWFFGRCRISHAVVCLAVVMVTAQALVVASMLTLRPDYMLLAIVISLFGIVGSVAFSFVTSRQVSPAPIHYAVAGAQAAVEHYQKLDPAVQTKIWQGGRLIAKLGAKHVGNHLRDKGYGRTADALQQGGRLI